MAMNESRRSSLASSSSRRILQSWRRLALGCVRCEKPGPSVHDSELADQNIGYRWLDQVCVDQGHPAF